MVITKTLLESGLLQRFNGYGDVQVMTRKRNVSINIFYCIYIKLATGLDHKFYQ